MPRWMANSGIIGQITSADPSLAGIWDFSISPPGSFPPANGAQAVANYKSFAQFQSDIGTSFLSPSYRYVLYDPESWPDTPPPEQQDPEQYLRRFAQLAHRNWYQVIAAPARDLANTATFDPKLPGEDSTSWYLRTAIADAAASWSDGLSIQSQALTLDPAGYLAMVTQANIQAKNANPYALRLAGISTNYGTAAQMAAAAASVSGLVGGFWLNVPGPVPDIAKAVSFLHLAA